jgi:hypothetical protein
MAPFFTGITRGLGGGGFGKSGRLPGIGFIIGSSAVRVLDAYQPFTYSSGDSIVSTVSGYYSFRISGGRPGSGGQGGQTEGSIYLVAGQSVYIRDIFTGYSRSGGYGVYVGNTNALDPSANRPNSTILVAGGGGYLLSSPSVGAGGGLTGGNAGGQQAPDANNPNNYTLFGGSQTAGGGGTPQLFGGQSGQVWYGGSGGGGSQGYGPGAGGGNGWYGGAGSGGDNQGGHGSGAGGSGYVSSTLVTPNTHGHLAPGATTTQGAAGWPTSSTFNTTKLEIKIGLV